MSSDGKTIQDLLFEYGFTPHSSIWLLLLFFCLMLDLFFKNITRFFIHD